MSLATALHSITRLTSLTDGADVDLWLWPSFKALLNEHGFETKSVNIDGEYRLIVSRNVYSFSVPDDDLSDDEMALAVARQLEADEKRMTQNSDACDLRRATRLVIAEFHLLISAYALRNEEIVIFA